eukprot:m.381507 g.381507  ORF g.381507 m.381507 type:complete len:84 (-) comp111530_c0_seq1:22-273(-)
MEGEAVDETAQEYEGDSVRHVCVSYAYGGGEHCCVTFEMCIRVLDSEACWDALAHQKQVHDLMARSTNLSITLGFVLDWPLAL